MLSLESSGGSFNVAISVDSGVELEPLLNNVLEVELQLGTLGVITFSLKEVCDDTDK